jgi:hypothetical protein
MPLVQLVDGHPFHGLPNCVLGAHHCGNRAHELHVVQLLYGPLSADHTACAVSSLPMRFTWQEALYTS